MIVNIILLVVFLVVTLILWKEGLWSSLVMLLNVLLAASVATAWFEWVIGFLEPRLGSFTYVLDFVVIWGLFAAVLLVAREASDRLSRTKVKLRKPVELFGTPIAAAITAWVVTCFAATTLHTAPVTRDFVQPDPETRLFFGLAPDRKWLQWVRGSSLSGPFARPDHVFDPDADFILRYADRRGKLEPEQSLRVNR